MPTVTEYYGITGPVEFVDVNVSKDNLLFVDPRAIRLQGGQVAARANRRTSTFFDEISRCVLTGTKKDAARGLDLLQHFGEPKETRLGMSERGIDGHGGAEDVGKWIWNALSTDLRALLRVGILKLLEDIPLFVEGVDKDITSDLTTRIVFEPLARFTRAMVAKHPEFTQGSHTTGSFRRQVWDPAHLAWRFRSLELPISEQGPLVLVPRDWVRPRLLMSSGRYYETTMLSFAQDQLAVPDRTTGKLLKDPKWALKRRRELRRGAKTIVRVTQEGQQAQRDLLAEFRSFVDARYARLSDEELEKRTN